MKKMFSLLLVLAMMLSLVACSSECDHDWEDATCEDPKTCSECGETKGKAAGHDWEEEDGKMICAECGEKCKHDFEDGECVECGMEEDGEGSGDVVIQEPQGTEPEEDDEPAQTTPPTPSYSGSSTQGGEFTFTWQEFADLMNAQLVANGSTLQIGFIKIDSDGDALYYAYSNGNETDYHVIYLLFDDYDETLEEVMILMSMDADEEEVMWYIELTVAASMVCDDEMTESEALNIYSLEPDYEDSSSIITEYWPRDVVHLLMYDGTNMAVYYNVLSENNY